MEYSENEPAAKDSFRTLHIVIAGNIYKTEQQIKEAYDSTKKRYDFSHELRNIAPVLNLGDIVIAQMKTSFTGDIFSPYSAPDEFALSIKYSGINQCVLANNNTAHIDPKGLLRTQRALGVFDIQTTGAYIDQPQRSGSFPRFVERKGFKIAILNYSAMTKKPTISQGFVINQIDRAQMESDMKIARDQKADYIIVYLDWGENMQESPSSTQEGLAKFLLEQGANLIVGTFPNTVQKIDISNTIIKIRNAKVMSLIHSEIC
ncbi:MAG TPA: CapA family protein [Chitinophagales bacterium]